LTKKREDLHGSQSVKCKSHTGLRAGSSMSVNAEQLCLDSKLTEHSVDWARA